MFCCYLTGPTCSGQAAKPSRAVWDGLLAVELFVFGVFGAERWATHLLLSSLSCTKPPRGGLGPSCHIGSNKKCSFPILLRHRRDVSIASMYM